MQKFIRTLLQMFADGGEASAAEGGVDSGSISSDAGRDRLKALGVPESRLKNRQYNLPAQQAPQATEPVQQEESQPVTGNEPTPTEEPKEKTYTESEVQKLLRSRLKSSKAAEENLNAMRPALEVLTRQYGMDADNIDYAKLSEAINSDKRYYEQQANDLGVPEEIAMQLDTQKRELERQAHMQQIFRERQAFDGHLNELRKQAEELKKVYPNFDLDAELAGNERFRKMTAPGGVSVEDAYFALHHAEIQTASMQAAVQKTQQKAAAAIQSGLSRPQENGASSQAPSVTTFDYSKANAEDRARIRAEMRRATANGQKVTPSMFYRK